jgi:hypothetical protein
MIDKINEAFKWLNEDLMYVSMVGLIEYGEINPNDFTKEDVEEQSFDHWYEQSSMISEDTAIGSALIPLEGGWYMEFEFNS